MNGFARRGGHSRSRFDSQATAGAAPMQTDSDGDESSETFNQKPKRQISLLARGIRFISQRDHSPAELRRKLKVYAETEAQIEAVLTQLEQRGWVNNERFTQNFVNRKAASLGAARIAQQLKTHDLPLETTQAALASLKDSELERCVALWQRKFAQVPLDAKDYAKQARFLQYRGFSGEIVRKVLKGNVDSDT